MSSCEDMKLYNPENYAYGNVYSLAVALETLITDIGLSLG